LKQYDLHRAAPTMTWDGAKTLSAPRRAMLARRDTTRGAIPPAAPLLALTLGAFLVRAVLAGTQGAYMDEGTYVITGRLLIREHRSYLQVLNWAYGSYVWPLFAGAADMVGGLTAVRLLSALFGALAVLGTALLAYYLAPPRLAQPQRLSIALIAGAIMALFPTAVGVGRFATYDPPAAAGFMLSVGLLAGVRRTGRKTWLLGAAALLFFGFLSKYVVAIYFPLICLYLMLSARSVRTFARNILCFVAPLSAACAAYFLIFHSELLALVHYSSNFTDLKSDTPMREYVTQRPELYVLAAVALFAWRKVEWPERLISFGGLGVIVAFQAIERPDYDWWKHSIYAIYFLAPLAAIAVAPLFADATAAAARAWQRVGSTRVRLILLAIAAFIPVAGYAIMRGMDRLTVRPDFGHIERMASLITVALALLILLFTPLVDILRERRGATTRLSWRAAGTVLVLGMLLPIATATTQAHADALVTFYPDLSQAAPAIRAQTEGARIVLADDTAVRYYLLSQREPERVIDPFAFNYRGADDMEAYRRAITDRYFDAIVLDGGIGPVGQRIRKELSGLIGENYDRVYSATERHGFQIEVYHARVAVAEANRPVPANATVYRFDGGVAGWGTHNDKGDLQPGLGVTTTTAQQWSNLPALMLHPTSTSPLVSVRYTGHASQVRAQVYVVGADPTAPQVQVGMVGFDANWNWHDNGFKNDVTTGRWIEIVWNVANVASFNEVGLQVTPGTVQTLYVGRVEIDP